MRPGAFLLQESVQLLFHTVHIVQTGKRDVVGCRDLLQIRAAVQIYNRIPIMVGVMLILTNHAQEIVLQYHDLDGNVMLLASLPAP